MSYKAVDVTIDGRTADDDFCTQLHSVIKTNHRVQLGYKRL